MSCAPRRSFVSSYGSIVNPVAADTYAQVFRALGALGFRERQARDALERVRAKTHVGEPIFQGVIREALAVLTESGPPSPRRAHGRGEVSVTRTCYRARFLPTSSAERFGLGIRIDSDY